MNAARCIKCFECKEEKNAYCLPFRLTGESVWMVQTKWTWHKHKWNDINSLSIQLYIFGLFFEWKMMITYIQHTAAFTEPCGIIRKNIQTVRLLCLFSLWDGIVFMKLPRSIYSKKPVSSTDFLHLPQCF